MKTWLVVGAWSLAMVASIAWATRDPTDDQAGESVATLAERTGSVQYRHEDFAIWDYVSKGHRFFGAEVVATGPESSATVRFNDGRALELGPGAQVGLSLAGGAGAGGLVVTLLKGDLTVVASASVPKSAAALSVRAGGRTVKVEAAATVKMARKLGSDATTIEVVKGKAEVVAAPGKPAEVVDTKPVVVADAPKAAEVARPTRVATYFQAAKANGDGTLTVQPAAAVKVERVVVVEAAAAVEDVNTVEPPGVAAAESEATEPSTSTSTSTSTITSTSTTTPTVTTTFKDVGSPAPVQDRPRTRKSKQQTPAVALATPVATPAPAPEAPATVAPAYEIPYPDVAEEPAPELALAVTVEAREEEEDKGPALAERLSVPAFSSGARYGVPLLSGALAEKATYATAFAAAAVGHGDRVRAKADLWPEANDVVDGVDASIAAQRLELGYGLGFRPAALPVRFEVMPKLLSARVAATLPASAPDGRREPRSLDARFTGVGVGGTAELVWRRSLLSAEAGWVPPLKTLGLELSGAHFTAEWQFAVASWANTGALALAFFVASESTKVEQAKDEDDGGLRKVEFKQIFAGGGLNLSL